MRPVRRHDHTPRVEMMPLIDVVFLLLTFFIYAMVVMVELKSSGVALVSVQGSSRLASKREENREKGAVFAVCCKSPRENDEQVRKRRPFREGGGASQKVVSGNRFDEFFSRAGVAIDVCLGKRISGVFLR